MEEGYIPLINQALINIAKEALDLSKDPRSNLRETQRENSFSYVDEYNEPHLSYLQFIHPSQLVNYLASKEEEEFLSLSKQYITGPHMTHSRVKVDCGYGRMGGKNRRRGTKWDYK